MQKKNGNVIRLDHNQFVSTNRSAAVELKITLEAFGIETVIELIQKVNPDTVMVINQRFSRLYKKESREKYHTDHILFSPEFFKEKGHALYDNLYPSHAIVGSPENQRDKAHAFAALLQEGAISRRSRHSLPILRKLRQSNCLQNTYLAMRVAFFNELDTYAEVKKA